MKRCWSACLLLCLSFAGILPLLGADSPLGGDDWKYDIVYRKRGDSYRGLVLQRDGREVRMWCIVRNPGRPTVFYRIDLPNDEIARVEMLPNDEQKTLRRRFTALQEEHRRLPDPLQALQSDQLAIPGADKIELHETAWRGDAKTRALAYRSSYFELQSNAPRRVVLVAAGQLEQVYAAYVRCLPPRARVGPPPFCCRNRRPTIRRWCAARDATCSTPPSSIPTKIKSSAPSIGGASAQERERIQAEHAKLRAKANDCEAELRKVYKGDIPTDLKAVLAEQRRLIREAETRNQETLARSRRRLFQRLFHEAFHAYLLNFVYPPDDGELPRWLNEGLAQIFETAVFEVGELRIGHADKERLEAVRQALGKNDLLPLTDLLRAGGKQFQVAHDGDKLVSDRYYLASWALAFYLTFDRKVLGTPALDAYVSQLKRGSDPLTAFHDLTGQPLAAFERDFLHYLNHLHLDGRVGEGR